MSGPTPQDTRADYVRCPFIIDGECPCLLPKGHSGLHACRHDVGDPDAPAQNDGFGAQDRLDRMHVSGGDEAALRERFYDLLPNSVEDARMVYVHELQRLHAQLDVSADQPKEK